jgi:hypothetical protein
MRRLGWLAAAGALACAPERPPWEVPPVVWAGEHLEYAPQDGAYEPCAGTLPYMDRYVERVADLMDVELEQPLVYIHGSDEVEPLCENPDALGCARGNEIYAHVVPQEHELVHGVRASHGFSHFFFEEGAAEAFGDDAHMPTRVRAHGELIQGIESGTTQGLPIEWYPRAGHFSAFLHDRYGAEVTRALLRRTDRETSGTRAVGVIEEATGVPFEVLRRQYDSEPTCTQAQYRHPVVGCEGPFARRVRCDATDVAGMSERIACDDAATLGPRDGEIWKYLGLEVENDGEYWVSAHSPVAASFERIEVKECALGCGSVFVKRPVGIVLGEGPVFLYAGRYVIKVVRPEGEPGEVEIGVRGAGCR